jgi:hypothetical protein
VAATVADYLVMLGHELRGESYNKKEHNRRLQVLLNERSAGAIEFKHANISAVLIELGLPYVDGYKPRGNYQELLRTEILAQLEQQPEIFVATATLVDALVAVAPRPGAPESVFVPPPVREPTRELYERKQPPPTPVRRVNYLEREARNASLGRAGEDFVLGVEHRRLWESGRRDLAEKLDHVSVSRGDGLGYDVLSFELDGRERLIEVKTTAFGAMTPFFASAREVKVSADAGAAFHLYRVFKFRESPRIFTLVGSLHESCRLDPVQFRASL